MDCDVFFNQYNILLNVDAPYLLRYSSWAYSVSVKLDEGI